MSVLTYQGQLVTTNCWCGIHYAVPSEFFEMIKSQHRDGVRQTAIYCPLGHTWEFSGKGEAELLQERLDAERARSARIAADRDQIQASLSATKGQVTKLKKRVAAGVCPCCGRTFQQLSRHMANKHPDYASVEVEA